jgi:lysozyme family protein
VLGNFKACLAFITAHLVDHISDDDVLSRARGITQAEYDAWMALHGGVAGDVWDVSPAIRDVVYEHSYWQPYGDLLPVGIDLVYFDTTVNEGPRDAVLFLQRALNICDDGHFGVVTAAAVKKMAAWPQAVHRDFIGALSGERRGAYRRVRGFTRYRPDWVAHIATCEAAALEMIK